MMLALVTILSIVGLTAWQRLPGAGAGTAVWPQLHPVAAGVLLAGAVFSGLACVLAMESTIQARQTLESTKNAILDASLAAEEANAKFDDLRHYGCVAGNVKFTRDGRG